MDPRQHKIKPLLINGFYFQAGMGPVIRENSVHGAMVYMTEVMRHCFFSGVFAFADPDITKNGAGEMMDRVGTSTLSEISLIDDTLSFTKQYNHRRDKIHYTFKKWKGALWVPGDLWVGGFEGESVGTGDANCVIHETTQDLFFLQKEG